MGGRQINPQESDFQCCFCGLTILEKRPDPVSLTVRLEDDAEQGLFCHWSCLKAAVHQSVPLYVWENEARG